MRPVVDEPVANKTDHESHDQGGPKTPTAGTGHETGMEGLKNDEEAQKSQ